MRTKSKPLKAMLEIVPHLQPQAESGRKRAFDEEAPVRKQARVNLPSVFHRASSMMLRRRFALGAKLGSGSGGKVYAVDADNGSLSPPNSMVVKLCQADDAGRVAGAHEVEALALASGHPNVVRFLDAMYCVTSGQTWILMERAARGSLASLLQTEPAACRGRARDIMRQLLTGVAHCHALGVLHWDIGPHNILVRADGSVCLADFGISEVVAVGADGTPAPSTYAGSITLLNYRAPEALLIGLYGSGSVPHQLRLGAPADLWSLGCVMAELADAFDALRAPESVETQLDAVLAHGGYSHWAEALPLLTLHKHVPPHDAARAEELAHAERALGEGSAKLLERLLMLDPAQRPSAKAALASSWLADTKDAMHE